jgi:DNA-directed RNA polymerase specialized sigma54-like protein
LLKIYRDSYLCSDIKGEVNKAEKVENISAYLEFGSCNPVELSLMSIGLSRSTALFLNNKVNFSRDSSPENLIEFLSTKNLEAIKIPEFRLRDSGGAWDITLYQSYVDGYSFNANYRWIYTAKRSNFFDALLPISLRGFHVA